MILPPEVEEDRKHNETGKSRSLWRALTLFVYIVTDFQKVNRCITFC